MAPPLILLLTILTGPGTDENEPSPKPPEAERQAADAPFATLREARDSVKSALRASNRASGRDASETAPAVVTAYRRLGVSERLPAAERRRLQGQLHARISELQTALRRREPRTVVPHAGGAVANAQELIDLIQTTIAPDTWAINGGKGTIFYYPLR